MEDYFVRRRYETSLTVPVHITDNEVCQLAKSLRTKTKLCKLQIMNLKYITIVGWDALIHGLERYNTIEELHFMDTMISFEVATAFATAFRKQTLLLSKLHFLFHKNMECRSIITLLDSIRYHPTLEHLRIRSLGPPDAFYNILPIDELVTDIDDNNDNDDEEEREQNNNNNINNNEEQQEPNGQPQQQRILIRHLQQYEQQHRPQLLQLLQNLYNQRIGNAFRLLLQDNTILQEFDLNANGFHDYDQNLIVTQLARGLHVNTTLVRLDLNHGGVGTIGAIALAEALSYNSTLRILSLETNTIGPDGLIAFSNVFQTQQNTTIQELILCYNDLDEPTVLHWATTLKNNTSLIRFGCRCRTLPNSQLVPLLDALKYNTTLQQLQLFSNNSGSSMTIVHRSIVELFEYNDTIEVLSGSRCEQYYSDILLANQNKTREAPRKTEQRQHTMYNWLFRSWINLTNNNNDYSNNNTHNTNYNNFDNGNTQQAITKKRKLIIDSIICTTEYI